MVKTGGGAGFGIGEPQIPEKRQFFAFSTIFAQNCRFLSTDRTPSVAKGVHSVTKGVQSVADWIQSVTEGVQSVTDWIQSVVKGVHSVTD
jgi:hypothetical protein